MPRRAPELGLARGRCERCRQTFGRSSLALTALGVLCRACSDATKERQVALGDADMFALRALGLTTGNHW
jgi:hypothetical protein